MACDTIKIETLDADEVVSIVTAGPQGPSGSEAATLTTTGDMLYRAALANDRLPIGSEGQVLKVSSGLPAWGNESGAVTEVNGQTGAVVLDAADVGAAPASGIDPTAITGTAVVDNDARLSDSRTPSSHSSSHASAGSDPLFDQDLNTTDDVTFNSVTAGSVNAPFFEADYFSSIDATQTSVFPLLAVGDSSESNPNDGISFETTTAATNTRTNLGLGNSATLDTGTTDGTVAEGDHTHELNALDATGATDGHVLTADGAGGAAFEAIPSTALNDLSNVSAAAPSDNDVLVYDNATSTWVAEAPAAGGIAGSTGSTDNAILRADGTGGSTAQAADIVIDDATTSTQANVAIVNAHSETNSSVVITPKGTGAFILGPKPDGSATGGNARGVNAFCAVLSRSSASQVASGDYSIAIGRNARAEGNNSVALGASAVVLSNDSFSYEGAAVTGARAVSFYGEARQANTFAFGQNCKAEAANAVAVGQFAHADRYGIFCYAATAFALGASQNMRAVLRCKTTTDSAVEMFLDGSSTRLTVPSGKIIAMLVNITGVKSDGSAVAHYVRQYAIKNVGGTTSEVYAAVTVGTDNAASTSIALSANDTNDALKIEATGIASETWRWVACVDAVEVIYGS